MGVMAATAVEDVTNTTPLASAAAHRVFLSNSCPPFVRSLRTTRPPRSSDDLNPSPCGGATRPLRGVPKVERSSSAGDHDRELHEARQLVRGRVEGPASGGAQRPHRLEPDDQAVLLR